jgi:ABC-2 type transport system permease protein
MLPFRGLCDAPFRLYMGHIPVDEAWAVLLHQWTWIFILVGLGAWMLSRAKRRLVVQGG